MAKDIVLASDGSGYSLQAAKFIISAGLLPEGGQVHVVHVTASLPARISRFVDAQTINQWHSEESDQVLEPVLQILQNAGVACKKTALIGYAPQEITRYADDIDAHMIVMGSHGRGVLIDAVLGSVAGRVLGLSRRPVLLIQQAE